MEIIGKLVIADFAKLNADPAAHADVRWPEKFLRRSVDQSFLRARWYGYPDPDMAVIVVIIDEHGEHFLAHKERRLAVRELL